MQDKFLYAFITSLPNITLHSGREAVEVEPILDALPKLEQ